MSAPEPSARPLDPVGSIKTKLGLLVGVSVLVSVLLVSLGSLFGVPALLSAPVAVGVALAVTQLLAAGMTSPLREMTGAAARMARGDHSVRVRATGNDEVGRLAAAFNAMAADLDTVDQQRRDLIATVAHELRTPVAGVAASLENMADGVVPADEARLRTTHAQVERLGGLVRDLLDLSRAEAGLAPLTLVACDPAEIVDDVLAEVDPRGTRLERAGRTGLRVHVDPARLRQVVVNLVENAVRHSPPGGRVVVTVGEEPDGWSLQVTDEGPGIRADDRVRVFERFGTADASSGGTGLGLAICRWIVDLHGGRIAALDPAPGRSGARIRAVLPRHPNPPAPRGGAAMSTTTTTPATPTPTPGAATPGGPTLPSLVPLWPDAAPPRRDLLLAAAAVGVLAALLVPFRLPGLALSLVLLACGGVIWWALAGRRTPFTTACAALGALLALVPTFRDAGWLQALAILTGIVLVAVGATAGRTLLDFVVGMAAWPAAGLRGLPWLGRTIGALRSGSDAARIARTVVISLVLLLVFGVLIGTADALVGRWLDAVMPDLDLGDGVLRVFVGVAFFGAVLSAVFLSLAPLPVPGPLGARPVARRYEWLVPVLVVDLVFAVFLVAQAAAFFGGHDFIRDSTGLTYAEYVHQGFAQLTVATLLTLVVIGVTAARAPRQEASDRLWLRVALGVLCGLTLVVVASALWRMELYQQAYGYTVLRVLVDLFEGWLGLLIVLVAVAGIRLSGVWVARAGLLSGAALLLGLALVNPEAWIAERNLERAEAGASLDGTYLDGLSEDATPVLVERLGDRAVCVLDDEADDTDALGWNLARAQARAARADVAGAPGLGDPGNGCEQLLDPRPVG